MAGRRQAVLVLVFFASFFTLTNSFRATFQIPDEEYVLLVTENLFSGKGLDLKGDVPCIPGVCQRGKDGKAYSAYQIGQSLAFAPFYFATKQVLRLSEPFDSERFYGQEEYETFLSRETRRFLYLCPAFFAALACSLVFLFVLRLGYAQATALSVTILFGTGTMIWAYSKCLLTEALQTPLLLGTVYLLFTQRSEEKASPRSMVGAGALFGFLLSIRAIFIVLLPFLALYWFWKNKDRRLLLPLLAFGVPVAILLLPQLAYDHYRFGNVLATGYGRSGFSTPLSVGLFGYLLSPGKSFFLYTPAALLFFPSIRRFYHRWRREALLFLAILILVPFKYAGWWIWSGDPGWGPRYLVVITPFVVIPIAELIERAIQAPTLWRRALVACAFFVSFGVQVLSVSVHYSDYLNQFRRFDASVTAPGTLVRDPYFKAHFVPEFSPILGQWWMVRTLLTGDPQPQGHAPWAKLIRSPDDIPVKPRWDYWVVDLLSRGFQWENIKLLIGTLALVIFLTILGQELLWSAFSRAREPDKA